MHNAKCLKLLVELTINDLNQKYCENTVYKTWEGLMLVPASKSAPLKLWLMGHIWPANMFYAACIIIYQKYKTKIYVKVNTDCILGRGMTKQRDKGCFICLNIS